MVVIEEDDAASVIDVTEMSSRYGDSEKSKKKSYYQEILFSFFRLCDFDMDVVKMFEQKETTECSDIQKNSLAVRKFPSYGWSREREARIKATLQQEKRAVSCPPTTQIMHTVDFPRFELSGLSETAPKEIEGNAK